MEGINRGLPAIHRRDAVPAGAPDSWLRPNSPTYRSLKTTSELENILGMTFGSNRPAGVKEMNPEQAAASEMFRNNLEAYDPSGILRCMGEFGQGFRPEGNGSGMAANTPIHFQFGGAVSMPPGTYRPETSQVIHSHPLEPGHVNDYPSDTDYYAAYYSSRGNTGNLKGEMFYHSESDRFFGYEPRLNPATGAPEFHQLVNPYDMGPPPGNFEARRPFPDPGTWGSHFIDWEGGGGRSGESGSGAGNAGGTVAGGSPPTGPAP